MPARKILTTCACCLAALLAVGWQPSAAGAAEPKPAPPTWPEAQQAIEQALAEMADYQVGDILSAGMLDDVWPALEAIGWQIDAQKRNEMIARLPADNEFLVVQLRTPAGRKFMRQVQSHPLAYDQLDRLSGMPQGQSTIRRLIKGPDGYKLVEYLTTTSGGRNLGEKLSRTPKGRNFNQPTGRIYTQEELLTAFQALWSQP